MKHYGFTLAETLITLGIIGVIAALTLPSVMSNYKNKTYVAQLQKVYNQLSNAASQIMLDEEVDNLADSYLSETVIEGEDNSSVKASGAAKFIKKYFKVTKDCGYAAEWGDSTDCFAETYKSLGKTETSSPAISSGSYCASLNTGASICINVMSQDNKEWDDHGYSSVAVDINGKKGPNIGGRDFFTFRLHTDGKLGESYLPDTYHAGDRCTDMGFGEDNNAALYGANCFDKIVGSGWSMDY